MTDDQFLNAVLSEVFRARAKFPNQARSTQLLALVEEVGEAAQAFLQNDKNGNYTNECIQVAAMALRCCVENYLEES